MPLRDHFHPPVSKRSSWEGFHGLWPGVIVQRLVSQLPEGFVADPRVHLGNYYEIDDCAYEQCDESHEEEPVFSSNRESNVGIAIAPQAPPEPTLTLDAEFPEQYAYEVLVFDVEHDRRLVAAVEIVSPANKDRPESRQLFVAKCFNLLRQDVCLSIVDLVTIRQFNLYAELLALLTRSDPAFRPPPPDLRGDLPQTASRRADETRYLVPCAGGWPAAPDASDLAVGNTHRDAGSGSEL